MTTPIVEVSHLPHAASFYAALIQPLGLQFLSASSSTPRLDFGWADTDNSRREVLFSVSQTPSPRPAHLIFSATSPAAVHSFYTTSLQWKSDFFAENTIDHHGDTSVARAFDHDGNMLEAIYSSRGARSRVPVMETASTDKEARRVLEWQEDVARSVTAEELRASSSEYSHDSRPSAYRRAETFPSAREERDRTPRLLRKETITREHYGPRRSEESGSGEWGFSNKAIVGTLLGAAAGAAFAYAMVRSESPERMEPLPPPMPRRSSYGGPSTYGGEYMVERRVDTIPARSNIVRERGDRRSMARYVIAPPPERELGMIEERSHVSHRSERRSERGSKGRSRSEIGSHYERSRSILPPPAPSHISHISHSKSHASRRSEKKYEREVVEERRSSHGKSKAGSHVSRRSESTVKGPVIETVEYISTPKSKVSTTTTIRVSPKDGRGSIISAREVPLPRSIVSARDVPLPMSMVSGVSARDIPLPRSMVSGGGYAASVAPSDSISSVGIKREGERLRDRMRR